MRLWLGWVAGCAGDEAAPPAEDSGGPEGGSAPIVARCEDPGPDAPVVPRIAPEISSFEGSDLQVYLPEGLRAVVFYFYGSDDLSEWNGKEQTAFANQMFDAGIGWVVYSKARSRRGESWDSADPDFGTNEDLARLQRLWTDLVATTPLEADTPIVSVGFSDGGAFALMFASETRRRLGWPVAAALLHNSAGGIAPRPEAPLWTTASDFDEPSVLAAAERLAEEQTGRGFPSIFRRVEERSLSPEVFLRNAGWDLEKATEIFDDLASAGLVDPEGVRRVPDDRMEPAIRVWSERTAQGGSAIAAERMRVVWATHRYSALYTREECEFVLGALGL